MPCTAVFAEYSLAGAGFCLSGVTQDPVEELVLAMQIAGYAPTEAVQAYAAALVDLKTAQAGDDTAEE